MRNVVIVDACRTAVGSFGGSLRPLKADALARAVMIAALERKELGEKVCTYRSSTTDYYPDYDLHGATMTFRIV